MIYALWYRALRPLQNKDSTVGKLFAKHIKLEEAKQFLQRARYAYLSSSKKYLRSQIANIMTTQDGYLRWYTRAHF